MFNASSGNTGQSFCSFSEASEFAANGKFGKVIDSDGVFKNAEWSFKDGKCVQKKTWNKTGKCRKTT